MVLFTSHFQLKLPCTKKDRKRERLKIIGCNFPRLLLYNKLMPFVNSIDTGKVKDFIAKTWMMMKNVIVVLII